MVPLLRQSARVLVTLLVVLIAAVLAWRLWVRYQLEPWTRDGRVRADVVEVAPDVGGLVTEVLVHDNQPVRRGQLLFVIDPPRYALALAQAEAALAAQRATLAEARRESARNAVLGDLVAQETREQGQARVAEAEAAVQQAATARDSARLNLERTQVVAPMDGVLSNVLLRPGEHLNVGAAALALVDTSSLHVEGYFEETKLRRIRLGDRAEVRLIGQPGVLYGRVQSIAPAIADQDRSETPQLLPNVNPTFSWVRLAQRVPVRIALDRTPPGLRLIAGRTATVTILPGAAAR